MDSGRHLHHDGSLDRLVTGGYLGTENYTRVQLLEAEFAVKLGGIIGGLKIQRDFKLLCDVESRLGQKSADASSLILRMNSDDVTICRLISQDKLARDGTTHKRVSCRQ